VALLVVGFLVLTGFYAGVHPQLARDLGEISLGQEVLDKSDADLDTNDQNDAELERRQLVLLRRIEAKERVLHQLLAGRLTLVEAAVRFRAIERELPVTWYPPRDVGGAGEDERLCREVMHRVESWFIAHKPAEAAQVTARLEAELQQFRGPDGVVRLPD
jgi:hypothetical protein